MNDPDLTAFGMVPPDGNFAQSQTGAVSQKKQFNIESKPVGLRCLQNRPTNVQPKRFEPALRVPKWHSSGQPHDEIENAPSLFATPRLVHTDQFPVQGPRSKSHID